MSSSAASERLVVPALCQPSLLADLPSHDTIFHLLAKHIPPHLRPARDTTGTFPPDESPTNPDLALAMRTNAWRRIALYARERIISAGAPAPSSQPVHDLEPAGPNDVSTVLRWWTVRLQALLRLRLYSQFQLELESLWAILKRTTIPRHSSSSSSSTATTTVRWARLLDSPIVPFSLHVLRAREPLLSADPRAALEKCHALLQRCKVMQRRFVRVAKVDGLLQEGTGTSELEAGARAEAGFSPTAQAYNLLFARLFLEAGAVASAQACIQSVSASLPTPIASSDIRTDSGSAESQLQQLLDVSKALLAVWQGDYPAAVGQWERVVHGPQSQSGNHMDMDNSREINPAAMSNLALSRFYQGNVDEATTLLERLLQDEPSTATSAEAVIFNLITMHELRSDDSISHKRRILVHVAQWAGDGTGTSCLKLI
ncbi:unnamed protein product [Tilletia controversa]|nr:unnamed protein product [Tilletia controversa]